VVGVMALRLANADVLPFHYSDYAAAVASYVARLAGAWPSLGRAARAWGRASRRLEAEAGRLLAAGRTGSAAIARINHALMGQERALTTLPGRPWYRHQIYAPGLVSGYDVEPFRACATPSSGATTSRCAPSATSSCARCAPPPVSREPECEQTFK
jgi:N-acetylated-alpha-linked acidic dipeptidase